jgi:hypothetical protein
MDGFINSAIIVGTKKKSVAHLQLEALTTFQCVPPPFRKHDMWRTVTLIGYKHRRLVGSYSNNHFYQIQHCGVEMLTNFCI